MASVPVLDGHNDTLLKLELAARRGEPADFAAGAPRLHIDLPRARAAGFAGGLFAMFTPALPPRPGPTHRFGDPRDMVPVAQADALAFTRALFARMHALARAAPDALAICGTAAACRTAMAAGKIVMLPHIEGAECIDPELTALEPLAAAGLCSLGPVWSRPNAFGDGAPMARQPSPDPGAGLTGAGRALIRACEQLGVLVDLSHMTPQGFWDAARIAARPLIASHSNAHTLSPSARNLTDTQLAAVAESGGLVGLNFHVGFLRADCRLDRDTPIEVMIRHLDHLLENLGEVGVALGSDFDGCVLPRAIGDVSGLPRLVEAMRKAGFGAALVRKICHENWLAALDRAAGR